MKQTLQVEVKNVNYQDGQYAIFPFRLNIKTDTPTANLVAFGNVGPIYKGDIVKIEGEWIDKKQYGLQFKVENIEKQSLASVEAVQKFLLNIGKEGKIGKRTIEKITNAYGEESIEMIKKNPQEVMKLRISEKKVNTLRALLLENVDIQTVFNHFKKIGISADTSTRLYSEYGLQSIIRSEKDPYDLYAALNFQEMELIAEYSKKPHNFDGRIRAAIMNTILENMEYSGELFFDMNTGNIEDVVKNYVKRKGYYKQAPELTKNEIFKVVKELGESNDLVMPLRYDMGSLFIKKYWELQTDIADKIERHIKEEVYTNGYAKLGNDDIEQYLKSGDIVYNEGQLSAIRDALDYKISIVTGGPGTGKTQTIKGIIQAFDNRHRETQKRSRLANKPIIQPCAPTGKAAQRIMDLTGKEAMTIHRLLGIRGGEVKERELEEVHADLIIVDEASMMDSQLFFYLISAVKPYSHIVIVGDSDQLPSIGKGFILRDLIGFGEWEDNIIGYNKLSQVYRQVEGNPIVKNAYSVLNHKEGQELKLEERQGFEIIPAGTQEKIKEALLDEIEKHISAGHSFDNLQILTPMNKGELGTLELNRAIQERFNGKGTTSLEVDKATTFKPGDKVMQTINNYDLEVFNGEVGKITDIESGPKITVDFGYKTKEYIGEDIRELTLAYAITVHKSQGSEFEKVIMPLDRGHALMLDKNLLYTAITRASEELVFIGEMETIKIAAEKKKKVDKVRNILDKIMKVKGGLM